MQIGTAQKTGFIDPSAVRRLTRVVPDTIDGNCQLAVRPNLQ